MLKYVDTKVVFQEVPDEISLAISISGCPHKCEDCHSSYLAEDIGKELTDKVLQELIISNEGISCIVFMGGDNNPSYLNELAYYIKRYWKNPIKVAWYSGNKELSKQINLDYFDYIKLGPYIKELGPLSNRTTNQRFYKVVHFSNGKNKLIDLTFKFWKHETEN